MTLVALAIPHAGWLPERRELMIKLRESLGIVWHMDSVGRGQKCPGIRQWAGTAWCSTKPEPATYAEFTDRCHWSTWALDSWSWATNVTDEHLSHATHFLTLQDDVEVAPNFWPALTAMLTAWPDDVLNLAATHSLGPEVARQGRRSYRTRRIVGWGWAMPREMLREMIRWAQDGNLERFRETYPKDGEDAFVEKFLEHKGLLARHPVPTIVDHLLVPSTNVGFDDHTHRRSTVTWRGYSAEDMANPEWWKTISTVLPNDVWRMCWWCAERPEVMRSAVTGASLCEPCMQKLQGTGCGSCGLPAEVAGGRGLRLCRTCLLGMLNVAMNQTQKPKARMTPP